MRLDTAIPLPEDEGEALRLLVLALLSTLAVTLCLSIIVLIWGQTLSQALGRQEIAPYVWLLPIGTALLGLYSAFQYLAVRRKSFGLIARARLTQALAGLGAQTGLGLASIAPLGLLVGHAIMSGAGVVALARRVLNSRDLRRAIGVRGELGDTLRRYKRFPKFSALEELTNNAGIQVPILLIGVAQIGPEAGFLFIAMRVVGMPLTVIGSAVAQVYYAHAGEYLRDGRLAEETARMVHRLSIWIVVPLVLVGPFAPSIFRVAFGPEWERGGALLVWMLPWYSLQLLVSPVSMVMYTRNLQHLLLGFAAIGFLIRVLPLGVVLYLTPENASLTYAATSAVYYMVLLVAVLMAAQIKLSQAIRIVVLHSAVWIAVAAVSFFLLSITRL
jgi:O-antigen/teichoic acid export membrane protein